MALIDYAAGMKKQFTATGYVVDAERTAMLMVFHKGLQCWLPPGGHVDPDEFPSDAALREVQEETGLQAWHAGPAFVDLAPNQSTESQLPTPFAMAAQLIPQSPKDVEHIHMDMMFLLEADPSAPVTVRESEVDDVLWASRNEVINGLHTVDSVRAFAREYLRDLDSVPAA